MTLNLLLLFEKVTSNFNCFLTNFIIIEPIKLVARTVTDILASHSTAINVRSEATGDYDPS